MAVVDVDGLTKIFPRADRPAVDRVGFRVADGEFLVLVGPSGCGKSTVLRMIAGLEAISAGSIAIDGRRVDDVPAKARDIAMVFQSYALYPHMTVYDNIAFGLRRRALPRGEIDAKVRAAAAKLALTEFLDRKPHALSGGQRQRVALGRAIVRAPKVFLFDEPLSNLDAALRATTRNELIRQQREIGTTSIFVTHDQVEAMTMGDRICVMNLGRIVQIGRPLELYRKPANTFVARFIGSPPMNVLDARLATDAGRRGIAVAEIFLALPDGRRRQLASRADGPIQLGLRPEDLHVGASPSQGPALPGPTLPGAVISVEALGAETIVNLACGTPPIALALRCGRDMAVARGDTLDVAFDLDAAHFFDPTTGQAIE